jgi:hypothetical protein
LTIPQKGSNLYTDKQITQANKAMTNMDYCRFENALSALRQCADRWDEEVEGSESDARQKLIELMIDLLNIDPLGLMTTLEEGCESESN